MSNIFDLQKRQEAVQFVLTKRNITKTPVMRVGLALDVSGSAKPLYQRGIIQSTIDRLVPVAMRFDDNGEMDVWTFHNTAQQVASVTKQDMDGYVDREILNKRGVSLWGGTEYTPPMQAMRDFYFGGAKAAPASGSFLGKMFGGAKAAPAPTPSATSSVPAMALVLTDGENTDREYTETFLRASVGLPVYWQMVGVGNPAYFKFIEEMADVLPNVGYVNLASLEMSDEALYDQLLGQELCDWVKKY